MREKVPVKKILIDIPFTNPGLLMRIRVPIINQQTGGNSKRANNLVNVVAMESGEPYLHFSPQPMFYITIRYAIKEGYRGIYMSALQLMRFKNEVKRMVRSAYIKDLFFYKNNVLHVNKDLSIATQSKLSVGSSIIRMIFCVVSAGDENNRMMYEGICLMLDSFFMYLTIEELFLLEETLGEINLVDIGIRAGETAMIYYGNGV